MAPRETEDNGYANVCVTNKVHYGMLWYFLEWSIDVFNAPFLLRYIYDASRCCLKHVSK